MIIAFNKMSSFYRCF